VLSKEEIAACGVADLKTETEAGYYIFSFKKPL
jgi:hypothetical protein